MSFFPFLFFTHWSSQFFVHSQVCYSWEHIIFICLNHIKKLFCFSVVGTDRGEYVPKNCNDIEVITHLLAEVKLSLLFYN